MAWIQSGYAPRLFPGLIRGILTQEPAWNGFLFRGRLPSPELLSLIKANFLQVFSRAHDWKWSDERLKVLHRLLVYGCLNYKQDNTHITFSEARRALQRTDHIGRAHSVYCLTEIIRKGRAGWKDFGKPFLEGAWPKETDLQTEETTLNFVDLARVPATTFLMWSDLFFLTWFQLAGTVGSLFADYLAAEWKEWTYQGNSLKLPWLF